MPLEVEVQLKDSSVKAALEAMALRHLPLLVDDGECDVFVWNSSAETNSQGVSGTIWL